MSETRKPPPTPLHPRDGDGTSAQLGYDFITNGYVLLPDLFPPEQIAALKSEGRKLLAQDSTPGRGDSRFVSNILQISPLFADIFANRDFTGHLQTLLGDDFLVTSEASLHYNFFSPWHTDTTSARTYGHDFFWSPNFNVIQVAIYFQDNDPKKGGGIDVAPGSHLRLDCFYDFQQRLKARDELWTQSPPSLAKRAASRLTRDLQALQAKRYLPRLVEPEPRLETIHSRFSVPSKTGSAICFNLRIAHRATPCVVGEPPEKMALFFVAGARNEITQKYAEWSSWYGQRKIETIPWNEIAQARS